VYWGYVCDVPGLTDQPAATDMPDAALPIAVLLKGGVVADPLTQVYAFSAIASGATLEIAQCPEGPNAGQEVVVIRYPEISTGRPVLSDSNRAAYLALVGDAFGATTWDEFFAKGDDFGDNLVVPAGNLSIDRPVFRSFAQFDSILDQIKSGATRYADITTLNELLFVPYRDEAVKIEADNLANGTNNPVPMFALVPFVWSSATDRTALASIVGSDGQTLNGNGPIAVVVIVDSDGLAVGNSLFGPGDAYVAYGG
jgi:hypothetical protein